MKIYKAFILSIWRKIEKSWFPCTLIFMPHSLEVLWGTSSSRIFCLSVRNSVPSTFKVQYLKFRWSYSNQTSSKGCSHFLGITCPWVGLGQNVGLTRLSDFDFVPAGDICVSQTFLPYSQRYPQNLPRMTSLSSLGGGWQATQPVSCVNLLWRHRLPRKNGNVLKLDSVIFQLLY